MQPWERRWGGVTYAELAVEIGLVEMPEKKIAHTLALKGAPAGVDLLALGDRQDAGAQEVDTRLNGAVKRRRAAEAVNVVRSIRLEVACGCR